MLSDADLAELLGFEPECDAVATSTAEASPKSSSAAKARPEPELSFSPKDRAPPMAHDPAAAFYRRNAEALGLSEETLQGIEDAADDECDERWGRRLPYRAFPKKKRLRAACGDGQVISIQATSDNASAFYAYPRPDDLDADAGRLAGCMFVREIIDERFQRRPFADIDSRKFTPAEITAAFNKVFGLAATPAIYTTQKGSHVVAREGWVTLAAHRAGLVKLSEALPNGGVDVGATSSLRLAGALDKQCRSRKELPDGVRLSQTLVQPLGAPRDVEAAGRREQADRAGCSYSIDDIDAGIAALTSVPNALSVREVQGTRVFLGREKTAHCAICKREHESDGGALVFPKGEATGRAYCNRSSGPGVVFKRPGVPATPANAYPGQFESKSEAKTYERPDGVEPAPVGDYLEGSACGLGKSKAAWDSIEPGQSVAMVSYRKSLSRSQGALHGCVNYSDISGDLEVQPGTRTMVQYESVQRVSGVPDVLIVDEFHGIRRQACGGFAKAKSWLALCQLVKGCRRLVVLDAEANNEDAALLAMMRGKPVPFVRNTHKPHTNKHVVAFASVTDFNEEFARFLDARARQPLEYRMANRFTVMRQWRKDVEDASRMLAEHGIAHKAYHGGTDQVQKAADFANHQAAWANCEAIVYNSTLEAGVSVEGAEWTTCWALLRGMNAVEASMQGLHRFRNIKNYYCFAGRAMGFTDYPTSLEGLYASVRAGEQFASGIEDENEKEKADGPCLKSAPYVATMIAAGDDPMRQAYSRMWVANQLELNRSARHWAPRFYKYLAETGFNIRHLAQGERLTEKKRGPAPVVPQEAVDACTVFKDTPAERLAAAPIDAYVEAVEWNRGQPITRDLTLAELLGRDKCALMRVYHVEAEAVDQKFIETFQPPKVQQAHRNLEALVKAGDSHEGAIEVLRGLERLPAKKRLRPRISTDMERATRVFDILRAFGFSGLTSTDKVPVGALREGVVAASEQLSDLYKARSRLWSLRPPRKPPADFRSHLAAVNAILTEQYGADIVATNKHRENYILRHTEWPHNPLAPWLEPQSASAIRKNKNEGLPGGSASPGAARLGLGSAR